MYSMITAIQMDPRFSCTEETAAATLLHPSGCVIYISPVTLGAVNRFLSNTARVQVVSPPPPAPSPPTPSSQPPSSTTPPIDPSRRSSSAEPPADPPRPLMRSKAFSEAMVASSSSSTPSKVTSKPHLKRPIDDGDSDATEDEMDSSDYYGDGDGEDEPSDAEDDDDKTSDYDDDEDEDEDDTEVKKTKGKKAGDWHKDVKIRQGLARKFEHRIHMQYRAERAARILSALRKRYPDTLRSAVDFLNWFASENVRDTHFSKVLDEYYLRTPQKKPLQHCVCGRWTDDYLYAVNKIGKKTSQRNTLILCRTCLESTFGTERMKEAEVRYNPWKNTKKEVEDNKKEMEKKKKEKEYEDKTRDKKKEEPLVKRIRFEHRPLDM